MKKCSICEEEYTGYGNNPAPVAEGRCCDYCNTHVVIPVRLSAIGDGIIKKYYKKRNKKNER